MSKDKVLIDKIEKLKDHKKKIENKNLKLK